MAMRLVRMDEKGQKVGVAATISSYTFEKIRDVEKAQKVKRS